MTSRVNTLRIDLVIVDSSVTPPEKDLERLLNDTTMATLTAVSTTSSTENNKRKSEENIARKATHRRLGSTASPVHPLESSMDVETSDGLTKTNAMARTTPSFRIPKLGR